MVTPSRDFWEIRTGPRGGAGRSDREGIMNLFILYIHVLTYYILLHITYAHHDIYIYILLHINIHIIAYTYAHHDIYIYILSHIHIHNIITYTYSYYIYIHTYILHIYHYISFIQNCHYI